MGRCKALDRYISRDFAHLLVDELKEDYPHLHFAIKATKDYDSNGFQRFASYQVKRGWSFLGRWFGNKLAEISCDKPEVVHYYDPSLEKILDRLGSMANITKVYHDR